MNETKKNNSVVITVKNEQGKEEEKEVLYTFYSEQTKKNYCAYILRVNEDGTKEVSAGTYNPENPTTLFPLETEEEWNTIEAILSKLEEWENGEEK